MQNKQKKYQGKQLVRKCPLNQSVKCYIERKPIPTESKGCLMNMHFYMKHVISVNIGAKRLLPDWS